MVATKVRSGQLNDSEGYKELTWNPDGSLAQLVLYTDSAKTKVLFTKTFTYVGGRLTQIDTVTDGQTVSKVLSYDGNGNLLSANS